jgi:hypothetical protein
VGRIVAAGGGGEEEAMGWVAACGAGAKWEGVGGGVGGIDGGEEGGGGLEEFVGGGLGVGELAQILFKGIWHALEPGRGFIASDVKGLV